MLEDLILCHMLVVVAHEFVAPPKAFVELQMVE
jgi:hypothetical protein